MAAQAHSNAAQPAILNEVNPTPFPRAVLVENNRSLGWVTDKISGIIEGKTVEEKFFLAKDQVLPSFLMQLSRRAQSYLAPPKKFENLGSPHKIYDWMFKDIREKLDVKSGDPIKPEHLE